MKFGCPHDKSSEFTSAKCVRRGRPQRGMTETLYELCKFSKGRSEHIRDHNAK